MTIERFSALAAIAWLVVNLLTFSATILRGDIRGFASGIAISGIGCLLLLGLVNPAGMVTRINLERSIERNLPLDASYLVSLGADAIPLVLERFDELNASEQCNVARGLLFEYPLDSNLDPLPERDWRYWNVARENAKQAISVRADELYSAAGARNRFELANQFENRCGQ
ncbi:MAG: DUF4153 domain-containing protein, partial [Pseudomonadota bacterium]|nr:DUF4153 domain-containing protein [Pseudomonadota bacterium]